MSETSIRVTAVLDATPARVFDLLATPHRHPEADASGTVISDDNTSPIIKTGQVFRMNMALESPAGTTEYQTDNHVTAFVPGKVIAWQVAPANGGVLGWEWRYELEPTGGERTLVSLTYDWSAASAQEIERFGVPNFTVADLENSLAELGAAVTKD